MDFPFKAFCPAYLGDITFFATPAAAQAVCLRYKAGLEPEDVERGQEFVVETSAFGWVVRYFDGCPYEGIYLYYAGE